MLYFMHNKVDYMYSPIKFNTCNVYSYLGYKLFKYTNVKATDLTRCTYA